VLTALGGARVVPNVLFGVANCLLITAVSAYISANKLPFSAPPNNKAGSGGFLRVISVMVIGTTVGALQYFLYDITAVIVILTLLSGGAAWFVFDGISNFTWIKVFSRYEDS